MPNRALVLIDIQNDYFPGGKWALTGIEAAAVVPPAEGVTSEPVLFFTGKPLEPAELRALLGKELEPFKVPHRCIYLERLPLTTNGKTDRKALRSRVTSG